MMKQETTKHNKRAEAVRISAEEKQNMWKLLRKGDRCVVTRDGVSQLGFISSVIRLSCGKVLFAVCNAMGMSNGLFEPDEVKPADEQFLYNREHSFEFMLRQYEPTGQSTLTS